MTFPAKHGEAVIVPAAGLTVNWGPGVGWGGSESLPNVQATIIGASQGDTLVLTNRTREIRIKTDAGCPERKVNAP